ncbi:MAG TPA: hypothetical protein VFF60_04340 [Candidatus Binatus sp.]|nr:hypothetical protein [Candidatus Binatus sp.]
MSLELWNTFATFGTFIVIAATAIAALVQLRHARGSNQIVALNELQDASQTPQFEAAQHLVQTELEGKLRDPEFRYQVDHRAARTTENSAFMANVNIVGNFYEHLGLLVKMGLLDRELALDFWSGTTPIFWERLAPYLTIIRRAQSDKVWENFEFLAVIAQDWNAAHPKGAYPAGTRRFGHKDEFLESDRQYSASRAPA